MFRYTLLGLLRALGPQHGYALIREYAKRSGLEPSSGNFYRELQRLSAEKLVRPLGRRSDGDPRRLPYEITPEGEAELEHWLAHYPNFSSVYDDDMTIRVLLMPELSREVVDRIIERWHDELWVNGKLIERDYENSLLARKNTATEGFDPLPLLSSRRRKHIAADMEFVEELKAAYREWVEKRGARPSPEAKVREQEAPLRKPSLSPKTRRSKK
ncbi:MAG: hypothetical protein KatS3mg076_2943 [Candidatus Binatia bacterium]|nr:MAG: hypothetical protein KatS3mg076_2943 [Candidatus Binatia bacterium]